MIVLACDIENEPGNVYLLNKFTGLPITGMNCYPGAGYFDSKEEAETMLKKVGPTYAQAGYVFTVREV